MQGEERLKKSCVEAVKSLCGLSSTPLSVCGFRGPVCGGNERRREELSYVANANREVTMGGARTATSFGQSCVSGRALHRSTKSTTCKFWLEKVVVYYPLSDLSQDRGWKQAKY
jgi:hypothetical protein